MSAVGRTGAFPARVAGSIAGRAATIPNGRRARRCAEGEFWLCRSRGRLRGEFRGGFGNELALKSRAFELDLARLPLALPARDRGRAVGRATHNLVEGHLALVAI